MQVAYAELHQLVDRLTPDQADAVRQIVRHLVAPVRESQPAAEQVDDAPHEHVRRLSFAGRLHSGRGDLAARSEEIIRSELGRSA